MRTSLLAALFLLAGCANQMTVEESLVIEKADEIISKSNHNIDSACRINTMADSMTRQHIAAMRSEMQAMKTVRLAKMSEQIKIVYVFDTIYVPIYEGHAEGLSKKN